MRAKLFKNRGFILSVAFFLLAAVAHAQTNAPSLGVVKGFKVPGDYFEAPYEQQMKSLLEGAEARPLGNNRFQLTGLKLTTFRTNGEPEMIVAAADCLFDNSAHVASSPGPLTVATADGQFNLTGIGFSWQHSDSVLYVSNSVHSILHRTTAGVESPGSAGGDIDIYSDHFTRDLRTGLSVYRDNVRLTGTNVTLGANELAVTLPFTNNVISLRENATWASGQRNGGGDELQIDRVNNSLRAIGNGYVKMPGTAIGTNSTATATNKMVEIFANDYELRTNWTEFNGNVRVTQLESGKPTGKMTCERMTAVVEGGRDIKSLVAETNVVVEQQDGRFTGGLAKFYMTNATAEFSIKPTWAKGNSSGGGDLLLVDQERSEMTVRSNAYMKLPGSAFSRATNTAPTTFTTVTSDDYFVRAGHAEFHGNARIDDAKMKVSSDFIVADTERGGTNIERIIADKNVKAELADSTGKLTHVTADHALYTLSDGLLRLTGSPMLKNDQGWLTGSIIVWDRTYDLLIARNQRMVFQAPDTMTNGVPGMPGIMGN